MRKLGGPGVIGGEHTHEGAAVAGRWPRDTVVAGRYRPTAMQPGSLAVVAARGRDAAPLVVAHRGAWEPTIPQNSLAAFERAIGAGADAVELDVRRTADGCVVVVHDARVRGRAVAKLELAQLRERVRAGQAPMLEEVLEALAGRIAVDVELKEDSDVEEAMAIVQRRLTPDQYVVTSFRDAALVTVKRACPDARTGLLLSPARMAGDLDERVTVTGADFIVPNARLTRGDVLSWAAQRGLASWVWTVNQRRALRMALDDPLVAAVITDRPARARELAGSAALRAA